MRCDLLTQQPSARASRVAVVVVVVVVVLLLVMPPPQLLPLLKTPDLETSTWRAASSLALVGSARTAHLLLLPHLSLIVMKRLELAASQIACREGQHQQQFSLLLLMLHEHLFQDSPRASGFVSSLFTWPEVFSTRLGRFARPSLGVMRAEIPTLDTCVEQLGSRCNPRAGDD